MVELSIAVGLGYIFLMLTVFSFDPQKKYYNRLFDRRTYFIHLAFAGLLALFGLYRVKYHDIGEVSFLMPIFFLIVFRLLDGIILKMEGRHILVVTRGDRRPAEYKWWIDGLFGVLSALIPLFMSLLLLLLLTNNPRIIGGHQQEATKIDPSSTK